MTAVAKRRRGAPQAQDPQVFMPKVCDLMRQGLFVKDISKRLKVSVSTIVAWSYSSEFSEPYARAREAQADALANQIVPIADGDRKKGDPNRDRLRVDARKWVAARLRPRVYGDKIDVTSDGKQLGYEDLVVASMTLVPKQGE